MHRKNVPSMEKSTRKSSQSNKSGGGTELDNTTKESSQKAAGVTTLDNSSSQVTLNEAIVTERGKPVEAGTAQIWCPCVFLLLIVEKLINFIKLYIRKNKDVPPTTLDYYKFVKVYDLLQISLYYFLVNWQRRFRKSYSRYSQALWETSRH